MSDRSSATRSTIGVADLEDVARRAERAVGQPLRELRPLPGGTSSITCSAETGSGGRVVVKVAPPGLPPVRNRDVLRQARALQALAAVSELAVPEVHGDEPGDPPEVPPLFVMDFVVGESYEPRHVVIDDRPPAADVRARATAAVDMLAALHAHDPARLGLLDEPTGLDAEVERWRKAMSTCELESPSARAEERVRLLLLDGVPPPVRPVVLHGDWRLGNMQCVGGEVRAVIDWEIWSIGDPRLDLAWMRLMSDPAHPTADAPDAPTLEPDELLRGYEEAAGSRVAELAWFDALVRYKQAAASALLVKNALRRGGLDELGEKMRGGIPLLLESALDHLGGDAART